ncbi:MAG: adenosylmethionine--8-amino-7-oxononanoate transaminase [Crocinitomicaceae bacterium]|nr:adenosylmethionine--8-amino-7-oxononanoate transaminase [Crocinitomicaceae bacterium]
MTLLEKDKKYVWHPFTQAQIAPEPIPVVKAEGIWLYAEDDKAYIDANSSWWTTLHGHCHPYIMDKMSQQLKKLDHTIFAGATHPGAVEAAERVVNLLSGNYSKAFFSDNGSTSVEVALKMVYQYWFNKGEQKKRFLAIQGSYHGDTFGAMSVGQRGYFNKPFEHLFFEVDFIPFPTESNIDEVVSLTEELLSTGEFAGFIFEPLVQGAAGMRIYQPEWLNKLVDIAKQHDVLTIADEVMTGFYRTGTVFAMDQIQHQSDIVCLSKGLTGGVMALGMTVTTAQIFEAFLGENMDNAFLHGHSFTANPIACSAICASLDLLEKEETRQKVNKIGEMHRDFCLKVKDHPGFRSAKSIGTILSLEIEVNEDSSYFETDMRTAAYNYFIANELLIRPLGNVIFVNPPYCITEGELEKVYHHILEFVNGKT